MVEDQPPGFRFYPTEEELVSFYLRNKLLAAAGVHDSNRLLDRIIPVVNIYNYNPWDLPQFSQGLCHRDPEQWFFFIPRQENEDRRGRPNRLTGAGYWKATGSPGFVYSSSNHRPIGEKRTMVFYRGRAPNGTKTEWKMNEYTAIITMNHNNPPHHHHHHHQASSSSTALITPSVRQEFSLCRVSKQSKCLRAFDRRPPPLPEPRLPATGGGRVVINEAAATLLQPVDDQVLQPRSHHHRDQATTSSSSDHQNLQMVISSSINAGSTAAVVPMRSSTTSSPDDHSSSSGDHAGLPPQIGESSSAATIGLDSNTELWWDLEQLYNWLP